MKWKTVKEFRKVIQLICRTIRFYLTNNSLFFLFIGMILIVSQTKAQQVQQGGILFPRPFSPQEGLIKPVEKPYRDEICLNGSWQFQPVPLPEGYNLKNGAPLLPEPVEKNWSSVPIKHISSR